MRRVFPHNLILSLSNSLTPDLTAMLYLTCTLLAKSGILFLPLFFPLPMNYTPLNAACQCLLAPVWNMIWKFLSVLTNSGEFYVAL